MRRPPPGKPLSHLLGAALAPALKSHGLVTSELITRWEEIVGPRFAEVTRPLRVTWPRLASEIAEDRPREAATLVVRCESAHALDFQHSQTVIVERIAVTFGWRAVGRISIRQGPFERRPVRLAPAEPPPLPPETAARLGEIEDAGLRAALDRLGRAVRGGV